ncbi:MAG: hypothetical protein M1608_08585, partial [Candidatus Omnitrophica bacterium]|nr:hypothetical protein [Candidatus Omnitrophota bacterium]
AGFSLTAPEQAQFLLRGTNNGRVEARLTERINNAELLAKAYTGAALRRQAHALADDIVLTITGKKGIAQTQIVFKGANGGTSEIYVSDYDGHNAMPITQDHKLVAAPYWVPGRRVIYYTSYLRDNPDIYSQDLQTGVRKLIARYSGLNTSAAVSPDGSQVAMILSKAGSPDVWVAHADGTGLKQLTNTREDESSPCWSPDGKTLCFTSRMRGRAELYTIPSAGGQMKRLTTIGAINTTEPDWSPDGQQIAFTALMGNFQIWTLNVQTHETKMLADGEDPSWAPNSRTLIFARRTGSGYVLSLLDEPTKKMKDIARVSGSCSQPCWAR